MPFNRREGLLAQGMSWGLERELETQIANSNLSTFFGGAQGTADITNPPVMSTMRESGNLMEASGNPLAANLADTTEDILSGIVLPGGAFDVAGRQLIITAQGKFGATANNKRFRLWLNPTTAGTPVITNGIYGNAGSVSGVGSGVVLFDSTVVTTNAGNGWWLQCVIIKYGAAGSNTQLTMAQSISGTTHGGVSAQVPATQTESAPMNFILTGGSTTTGAANDIVLNYFEVTGFN